MSFAAQFVANHPVVEFRQVVNLTPHHVGLYDTAGNIAICVPGCHSDLLSKLTPGTMVIVSNNSEAIAFGIPAENTVIVDSIDIGRLGQRLSRLVRPTDGATVDFSPPAIHRSSTTEVYYV